MELGVGGAPEVKPFGKGKRRRWNTGFAIIVSLGAGNRTGFGCPGVQQGSEDACSQGPDIGTTSGGRSRPFRRDCRICQESSAKSKPHRRVLHPLAGTFSVDTAGPFKEAMEDGGGSLYLLKPAGGSEDPPDESLEDGVELLPLEEDREGGELLGEDELLEELQEALEGDALHGELP